MVSKISIFNGYKLSMAHSSRYKIYKDKVESIFWNNSQCLPIKNTRFTSITFIHDIIHDFSNCPNSNYSCFETQRIHQGHRQKYESGTQVIDSNMQKCKQSGWKSLLLLGILFPKFAALLMFSFKFFTSDSHFLFSMYCLLLNFCNKFNL